MKIASHVEGTKAAIYVDGIAEGMTQEQVEEAVGMALSPVQDATGPWISVEERLPELISEKDRSKYVLAARGRVLAERNRFGFEIAFCSYDNYGNHIWYNRNFRKIDDVTHWMPLPELPEEEE